MTKKVRVIDAQKASVIRLKRVAAYARVSLETERLNHSLSAQVSYYSELIQKTPGWTYAGVFADDGLTGTKANRPEFQRMLAACEAGQIDIVLTKSISRFARNTVDLLEIIRHLKDIGVEVRFEKESISSFSEDGELMLTLLASFAQEEVRSISENVRWATIKRFQQGIPNGHFRIFGYRWEGDNLVVVPEEATVVKRIFQNFLDGKSRLETEREFAAEGITTRSGCRWVDSNIKQVLSNITYTGNLLFHKQYIADPITKKRKKNHGEMEQYYVENTHEAIIDMDTFQFVQDAMARRRALGCRGNKSMNLCCFSGIIKCGCCGENYMRSSRKNKAKGASTYGDSIVLLGCGTRRKKGGRCPMKEIPDRILRAKSAEALGLDEFDESVFSERIDHMVIPENGAIRFFFKDGSEKTLHWKSTAKHDCWTVEHKDAQRAWVQRHIASDEGHSEFTTRIRCSICGSNYRQSTRELMDDTYHYWRCGSNSTCGRKGLREDFLQKITAEVMGLPEHDPAAFREQVEYIEVMSPTEVVYHFKDGRNIPHDWPKHYPRPGWTPEQRAKYMESVKSAFPEERRKAMSERMKQLRKERGDKWRKEQ